METPNVTNSIRLVWRFPPTAVEALARVARSASESRPRARAMRAAYASRGCVRSKWVRSSIRPSR